MCIAWDFVGFSLVFSGDLGGVIGDLQLSFLRNVSYFDCAPVAPTIPHAAYAMFQMNFASITPLLMTGAFAERISFGPFIVFALLWEVLVYYPVAHWMWGGGWLQRMGALDFAGGIVIHTTAGASSLAGAWFLGQRDGFAEHHGEVPPSNLPMAATGATLLWLGWFCFNGGSALAASGVAVSAAVSTQVGASVSALVWLLLAWRASGKPSLVAVLNGLIAGMAGVTPASGYIDTQATIVLGVLLGVASFYAMHALKRRARIDDALDVSSVHGVTGVVGSLFIGLAADRDVYPGLAHVGAVFGGSGRLFGVQLLAVLVAGAWAAAVTLALMRALAAAGLPLRLAEAHEALGTDAAEHGESAYQPLLLDSRPSLNARVAL